MPRRRKIRAAALLVLLLAGVTGRVMAQQHPVPNAGTPATAAPIPLVPTPAPSTLAPPAPAASTPASPAPVAATPPTALAPAATGPLALTTRSGVHPDYARLVFSAGADRPVRAEATLDGTTLTVRFKQAVTLAIGPIRQILAPYLDNPVLAADGMSFTARIKRPVKLRQWITDDHEFVADLIPKPLPIDVPMAGDKPPALMPADVAVRVGRHGTYDRVVFDWPKPVNATTSEDGGFGKITFDQPARVNLDRMTAALPPELRPARSTADGLSVVFTLPDGRHLRSSRDGNHVMLDILATKPAPAEPTPGAKDTATPQAAPTVPVQAATLPPDAATTPAATDNQPAEVQTGSFGHSLEKGLQIRYAVIDDGLSVRFEWQQSTAAAVFRRGDALWVVFDQAQKLDFSDFHAANWPVVTGISQVASRSGTVLRLEVWSGFSPEVRRAGTAWVVNLRSQGPRPENPIEPQVVTEDGKESMFYPVFDPKGPISLVDPDAGDTLVIFPLPQLGQAIDQKGDYPDFQALASAQGLVFRPAVDGLAFRSQQAGVEVTAPGGLALLSDADRQAISAHPNTLSRLFDPMVWQGDTDQPFADRKQALQADIVKQPSDDRGPERLALARFYFASAMGSEALGVMKAMEHDAPAAADDPAYRVLRGACEELMGQTDAALTDLGDKALDDQPDVQLWRAVLAVDQGRWADAVTAYGLSKDALKGYPGELRRRISLKLAEAEIDTGNNTPASVLAADVLASNPTVDQADAAKVIQGRVFAITNDIKKATDIWTEVSKSPTPDLARVQARYALIMTKLDRGEMPRSDAITALDRLRFAWRGDDFEVRVLHKLAELYILDTDYRDGFATLKRIIEIFPNSPLSQGVAEEMQKYFVDLFLGKASDNVSPLKALSLYDEFKELTPAGDQGDAIIRGLADRLVSLDALDRAASLLDSQVKTRLSGVDQARVATQLAVVRLLDQKPDDAIAALDIPIAADIPPELAHQRSELRARALMDQNKPDDALKAVDGDTSADADLVRAEIYRQTQNWTAMAAQLQRRVTPGPDGKLTPEATHTVVNLAASLVLAKDDAGLAALKKKYAAALDDSPDKQAFQVITGSSSVDDATALKALLDKFAQGDDQGSFMSQYRQRVAQNKLSAIN